MIYLVKSGPFIRIGHIDGLLTLKGKLKSLQYGSPYKIELIGTTSGDQRDEIDWHRRYQHQNYRGDWFDLRKHGRNYLQLHPICLAYSGLYLVKAEGDAYDYEVKQEQEGACHWRESKGQLAVERMSENDTWGRVFIQEPVGEDDTIIEVWIGQHNDGKKLGYVTEINDDDYDRMGGRVKLRSLPQVATDKLRSLP